MSAIVIIAHAPLASALKVVAEHTFPDCAKTLEALDVPASMPADEVENRARELLRKLGRSDALILTDVFGATPCNVAQRLADKARVRVVTGINIPMLWRSLCYVNESLDVLVTRAMAGATQGVMEVTTSAVETRQAC